MTPITISVIGSDASFTIALLRRLRQSVRAA